VGAENVLWPGRGNWQPIPKIIYLALAGAGVRRTPAPHKMGGFLSSLKIMLLLSSAITPEQCR